MFRTKMIASALSAVCVLSSLAPVASATVLRTNSAAHMFLGSKTVKLSLHNASTETMTVTCGAQSMTIEPGKTVEVNAAVGTNLVNVNETKTHKAGEVLTQVSKDLSGATLHIG